MVRIPGEDGAVSGPLLPLPPDVVAALRDLEIRLGRPVKVRLIRLCEGEPHCRLVERGSYLELRCHDPVPGYFWHVDALRAFLRERLEG